MKNQLNRLALAAMLSGSSFALTFYIYNSTEPKRSNENNEPPIASVAKAINEIQRKPARNLMWESVITGEQLYPGEAVRTREDGEVRIQFEDGKFIDLEPESLVVLNRGNGEIALDLMEGSAFVNAKTDDESGSAKSTQIVLNSANGKVDLSGAKANLSKSAGNRLDLQVLEGSAQVKSKDGKTDTIQSGKSGALGQNGIDFNRNDLQVLSPLPQKNIFVDLESGTQVNFRWKGFPTQWKVALLLGSSRKDLKEIAITEKPGMTELNLPIPLGKHFWKLVGKDPSTGKIMAETSVYKNEVLQRLTPTMIFPTADAKIPVEKSPFSMTFKWQKGEDTARVLLELAKDPQLSKKITTQTFTNQDTFIQPNLTEGEYYWRISAYYEGSDKPLVGKIQKFEVTGIKKIEPPKPPVAIQWTTPQDKFTQFYIEKPELEFNWEAKNRIEEIAQYRVKYLPENAPPDSGTQLESKLTKVKTLVQNPGRYLASIEALDKDGKVIGQSEAKAFSISPLPRINSPRLIPFDGVINSKPDGRTELKWENIQGAKEYRLIVTRDGKTLANKTYSSNSTNLKNLMPGEYELKVIGIDNYGRESENPGSRKLLVPDKSNLKAPTLKKIKVN